MKTLHLLRAASLMLASTAVSAKTLEVTVSDIRNDKGNILVMAKVAGQEQPVYGMASRKGRQSRRDARRHRSRCGRAFAFPRRRRRLQNEDGRARPAEGYATRKCKLPAEHNTATLKLYYPATENE
nr:hypothetical protein [Alistipes onderdonkii]